MDNRCRIAGLVSARGSIRGAVSTRGASTIYPAYTGETNVIPSSVHQELQTKDKIVFQNIDIAAIPSLQAKSVVPCTERKLVEPSEGFSALSSVTVEAVTSEIDGNITSDNIKDGVNILGVEGSYVGEPVILRPADVLPSTIERTITPPEGVDGFEQVHALPVTAEIDSNIQAGNIKDGVSILGVLGTLVSGASYTDYTVTGFSLGNGQTVMDWINANLPAMNDGEVQLIIIPDNLNNTTVAGRFLLRYQRYVTNWCVALGTNGISVVTQAATNPSVYMFRVSDGATFRAFDKVVIWS